MSAGLLLVGLLLREAAAEGIAWHASLKEALDAAEKSGKMVMLSQHTEWCHWCQELARTTWPAKEVIAKSAEFECARVDPEKEPLDDRYKAEAFPTILFLTPEGEIADVIEGYLPPEEFVKAMDGAKEGAKRLAEIRELEKKLAETPDDRALAARLARLQLQAGRTKRGLELLKPLYEALTELDEPMRGEVALDYGAALVLDAQFETAEGVLKQFVAEFPEHKRAIEGRVVLGVALANLGKLQEAREQWQKVVDADPEGQFAGQARDLIKRVDDELGKKP